MNDITNLLQHPGIDAFGHALLHSLWQGALVASLLFLVLRFAKKSSNLRYLLGCGALLILLLAFGTTYYSSYTPDVNPTIIPSILNSSANQMSEIIIPESSMLDAEQELTVVSYQALFSGWVSENIQYIFAFWLLGFLTFSSRFCVGLYYAEKLKNTGIFLDDGWAQRVDQFRHTFGIKRPVRLLTSEQVQTPLTIGWIRPVILVPVSMMTQLPFVHIESVLLHELAHIKRQDYLINMLQSLAETLLFFNPAYWYIAHIIEKERENACDDMAVNILKQPVNYARALAKVAELSTSDWRLSGTSLAASRGVLSERIRRIVLASTGQPLQRNEKAKWYLMSIIVISILVGVMITDEVLGNQQILPEDDVEVEVNPEVEADMDVNLDPDIDIDEDNDLEIEENLDIDLDVMGAKLDSSSLYRFLFTQWEGIKMQKQAKGEEIPYNALLSEKTLYVVDGEARDPKNIKPPFDYNISIPHTVMWAAIQTFVSFDNEESYAAFRSKYLGDYNTVVFLTSKSIKKEANQYKPFTVVGQVYNSKTKNPMGGATVSVKEGHTSTVTDNEGNFSIIVPNSQATLVFTNPNIYPSVQEMTAYDLYRDKKMIVRWYERNNPMKKLPDVQLNATHLNQLAGKSDSSLVLTGRVTDLESGKPLPGVNIIIKGSVMGTVTDINGNYKIRVPNEEATLVFVYAGGYQTQEMKVKGKKVLNPKLVKTLQNQYVPDTGTVKGKASTIIIKIDDLTRTDLPLYFVDRVERSPEFVTKLDSSNLKEIEIIKGQTAIERYGEKGKNGVVLITSKNEPSKGKVQIRLDDKPKKIGDPLFVIDGKQFNVQEFKLATLSPDDIASVDVLKNDAAIQLYGEAAKNGAIIIKTKSNTKADSSSSHSSRPPIFIIDQIRYTYQELSRINTSEEKFITIKSNNSEFKVNIDPNDVISTKVVKGGLGITSTGDTPVDVVFIETKTKSFNKENTPDMGPSFQEAMDMATNEMLDTMVVNDIHSHFLTLDQSLNRTQSSLNKRAKESGRPISTLNFSSEKVLYLLDGVETNPKSIRSNIVQSLEVIRKDPELSYQDKGVYGYLGVPNSIEKFQIYSEKYPGNYEAFVVATSMSQRGDFNEVNKNNASEQEYFNTIMDSNSITQFEEKADNLNIFPNPSENRFKLRFTLENDAQVQATVINAAGRIISTITDRKLGKGDHEIEWDASDQKPGIYRIRIIQNGETSYRNVVVK